MTAILVLVVAFWVVAMFLHVGSLILAYWRLRGSRNKTRENSTDEFVSIVRPICGLDQYMGETLRSGFNLDYPNYELVFCAESETDPSVPLVRRLMIEYPRIAAKLLIGADATSVNPKLNNLLKSWPEITGAWVVFSDDNILLPRTYIGDLLAAWGPRTGAVSSIQIGTRPENFWTELECAFLNPFHARWYLASAEVGAGYASGKTIMMRRDELERAGGLVSLSSEIAEDAAVTTLVHAQGRSLDTLATPLEEPLGSRAALRVYGRQVRWARLRRVCIPHIYAFEFFAGSLFPLIAAMAVAAATGWPLLTTMLLQLLTWYGAEALFLNRAAWPLSWQFVPAAMLRDLLLPAIWIAAWSGAEIAWRDKAVYGKNSPRD